MTHAHVTFFSGVYYFHLVTVGRWRSWSRCQDELVAAAEELSVDFAKHCWHLGLQHHSNLAVAFWPTCISCICHCTVLYCTCTVYYTVLYVYTCLPRDNFGIVTLPQSDWLFMSTSAVKTRFARLAKTAVWTHSLGQGKEFERPNQIAVLSKSCDFLPQEFGSTNHSTGLC